MAPSIASRSSHNPPHTSRHHPSQAAIAGNPLPPRLLLSLMTEEKKKRRSPVSDSLSFTSWAPTQSWQYCSTIGQPSWMRRIGSSVESTTDAPRTATTDLPQQPQQQLLLLWRPPLEGGLSLQFGPTMFRASLGSPGSDHLGLLRFRLVGGQRLVHEHLSRMRKEEQQLVDLSQGPLENTKMTNMKKKNIKGGLKHQGGLAMFRESLGNPGSNPLVVQLRLTGGQHLVHEYISLMGEEEQQLVVSSQGPMEKM